MEVSWMHSSQSLGAPSRLRTASLEEQEEEPSPPSLEAAVVPLLGPQMAGVVAGVEQAEQLPWWAPQPPGVGKGSPCASTILWCKQTP